MENYQGDLADIIRGGPINGTLAGTTISSTTTTDSWQFQSDPTNYQEDFGLPFSSLGDDPLLNELDMSSFTSSNNLENYTGGYFGNFVSHKIDNNIDHRQEEIIKRPCNNNIFSRMLQISPNNAKLPILPLDSPIMAASSPRVLKGPPPSLLLPNDHVISGNSSKASSCLIENTGVQISSPRNSGIKRRKSQAKKVVCIPAPAPANSRPTGEIVPSDLWAWRKYGQKPIKGSPYPRGYYRCSSSKGCSARKQVERSRTDPNMLVITYTSEHNHPWPTQRNALAGSTRSTTQTAKNNISNSPATTTKNSPTSSQSQKPETAFKEEQKECNNNVENTTANSRIVKEEEIDDKDIEMEDGDQFSEGFATHEAYMPALPVDQSMNSDHDFFADLGEIESDPLNLLFTQGFSGDEERESNKGLDPFSFYDWTGNSNNTTSFGDYQAKRGS